MNRSLEPYLSVLSASRRTDIPAFYLDWFMDGIDKGVFNIPHPFTRKKRYIPVRPENFHSIIFWSKNYDRFLKTRAGQSLMKKGFHLYFNFTINSESMDLEPGLPPLPRRTDQLRQLAETFGPQTISWRFDPICFYIPGPDRTEKNNLSDFQEIAGQASGIGIQKCVTSFFDPYRKIDCRLKRLKDKGQADLSFIRPSLEKKQRIIQKMAGRLKKENIGLFLCSEKELFSTLDKSLGVKENACIDGHRLKSLFNGRPDTRKDYGQRSDSGCRCTKSIDIGSYEQHPCHNNCLYCYAAPAMDLPQNKGPVQ